MTFAGGVHDETHFGGNVNGRFDLTIENGQTSGTNNAAVRTVTNLGGTQHIGAFQTQAHFQQVGISHSHPNGQSASTHIQVTGTNTAMFLAPGHAHSNGGV